MVGHRPKKLCNGLSHRQGVIIQMDRGATSHPFGSFAQSQACPSSSWRNHFGAGGAKRHPITLVPKPCPSDAFFLACTSRNTSTERTSSRAAPSQSRVFTLGFCRRFLASGIA
jgi:hypothetical protein